MKLEEYYTISELLQLNEKDSRNEFDPKFGIGAERNSNANEKAVNKILKDTQKYNDAARKEFDRKTPNVKFEDYNKTTMDVRFEYDPGDEYRERVKKLATTGLENDKAECYSTEGNEKFYNDRKEMSKARSDRDFKENIKGVVGRNNDDHDNSDKYKNPTPFVNENQVKKRLKFKNSVFLSEAQVLAHVPDDYKTDNNRFYMQDMTGTDYLVECREDQLGCMHVEINGKQNRRQINEELDKIKRLSGYNPSDNKSKSVNRSDHDLYEGINNIRNIMNNNQKPNNE